MRCILLLAVLLSVLCGCAASPRFVDQSVVWQVDDSQDIELPKEAEFHRLGYGLDVLVTRQFPRVLELRDREPAHDTNALDEVPDSTWFTNRIGMRDVSPEEAAIGPMVGGPPRLPLHVVCGKGGGMNPGFIVEDTTGRRFIIKFDTKDYPEMQTGTNVIVNRIFWTLGYNVPQDTVFLFGRDELFIAEGAEYSNELGREKPVTDEWVDEVLASSPRTQDGRYRATASQFLEGVPRGGWSPEGTRLDDPNDLVAHEHRRELRGLRVFAAWLGHADTKPDNTLDMYVEEDGRRFLRHYLLDFGEALGALQADDGLMETGWEHRWDWQHQGAALATFGLWKRPWEDQHNTKWPAIGAFSAEFFEPEQWRTAQPYWPFRETDPADLYWGAKLVLRFDRPLLEAVVAEGQFSDPEASAYLVDALMGRREKIGLAWLEAVTPLDYFSMRDGQLCATDVGIQSGIASHGVVERVPARYRPDFDDGKAEYQRGVEEFLVGRDGEVCFPLSSGDGYHADRLRIRRGTEFKPIMQVHYMAGDHPRVLGVIRVEP